jgi:hypothetical protein
LIVLVTEYCRERATVERAMIAAVVRPNPIASGM